MKKLITVLFLIAISTVLFASPSTYFKVVYDISYDSNVYSEPLPRYADANWLNGKVTEPYFKRLNHGISLTVDQYFSPKGRTGLSINAKIGNAFKCDDFIPEGDFNSATWEYVKHDGLADEKLKVFLSIGPIFRAQFGKFDLGIALRGSAGSFDLFVDGVIVGIQAEPYVNVFFNDSIFLNVGAYFDAHLMYLYTKHEDLWFKDGYTAISMGAFVGVGIKLGERG